MGAFRRNTGRVFVGLSGGVDSATSAALLHEQGYDVTGVFIKIWSPKFLECTWRDDRLDAMRAAVHIGIPFREIDLSNEYQSGIVDGMIRDYERGITPNPDVLCNKIIKFGAFYEWARSEGAEFVATGHYARIKQSDDSFELLRGIDACKDQSYFIYQLRRDQLPHVLFPVGEMQKQEVRKAARRFSLPLAEKPDSQGLCFIGDITLRDFLSRFIDLQRGAVLDVSGKKIGEHDGAALYTLGQRHGFHIQTPGSRTPHFVVSIHTHSNTITVSTRKEDAAHKNVRVADTSWLCTIADVSSGVSVQCRYREKPVAARLQKKDDIVIDFESPHLASPGQSAVMYHADRVLGGGTILPRY